MAAHEVVDLVSSDDETRLPPIPTMLTTTLTTTNISRKSTKDSTQVPEFIDLSDELDLTIPSWAHPSKKKPSPPHINEPRKKPEPPKLVTRESTFLGAEKDEIVFTSSPKPPTRRKYVTTTVSKQRDESDDELPELSTVSRISGGFSESTARILEEVTSNAEKTKGGRKSMGKGKEKGRQKNDHRE